MHTLQKVLILALITITIQNQVNAKDLPANKEKSSTSPQTISVNNDTEPVIEALPSPEALIGVPKFISNLFESDDSPKPSKNRRRKHMQRRKFDHAASHERPFFRDHEKRMRPRDAMRFNFRDKEVVVEPMYDEHDEHYSPYQNSVSDREYGFDPMGFNEFERRMNYREDEDLMHPHFDSPPTYEMNEGGITRNIRRSSKPGPDVDRFMKESVRNRFPDREHSHQRRNKYNRKNKYNKDTKEEPGIIGGFLESVNPMNYFRLSDASSSPEVKEMGRSNSGSRYRPDKIRNRKDDYRKPEFIDYYDDEHESPRRMMSTRRNTIVEPYDNFHHKKEYDTFEVRDRMMHGPKNNHEFRRRGTPQSKRFKRPFEMFDHQATDESRMHPMRPRNYDTRRQLPKDPRLEAVRDAMNTNERGLNTNQPISPQDFDFIDDYYHADPSKKSEHSKFLVKSSEIKGAKKRRDDPRLEAFKFKDDYALRDDLYVGQDGNIYVKDIVESAPPTLHKSKNNRGKPISRSRSQSFKRDNEPQYTNTAVSKIVARPDSRVRNSRGKTRIIDSASDGRIKDSRSDGRIRDSKSDSRIKDSPRHGNLRDSESDSIIIDSPNVNRMKDSRSNIRMKDSRSDSRMKDPRSDSRMKDPRSDSRMKDSRSDIIMKDPRSDIRMKDPRSDSRMKDPRSDSRMKDLRSDSRRTDSESRNVQRRSPSNQYEVYESPNEVYDSPRTARNERSEDDHDTYRSDRKTINDEINLDLNYNNHKRSAHKRPSYIGKSSPNTWGVQERSVRKAEYPSYRSILENENYMNG